MEEKNQLPEFDPVLYYDLGKDSSIQNENINKNARLKSRGIELVAQYYAEKYNAVITLPTGKWGGFQDVQSFVWDINNNIKQYIDSVRSKEEGDCRVAFYLGASATHATPIIYIRENGKEGILYADTKGVSSANQGVVSDIQIQTGIPVYAVEDWRQADEYSCYTEALVFSCKATAKDYPEAMVFGHDATAKAKQTEEYRIPQLLNYLEKNSVPSDLVSPGQGQFRKVTKLPSELLKTSQSSSFVKKYSGDDLQKTIHKGKTLTEFREGYTEKDVDIKVKDKPLTKKDISSYLKQKGIKFSDVIEIQFYANHLQEKLGKAWSDELRKDFIRGAKSVFRAQPSVHKGRAGLYEFAEKFLFPKQSVVKNNLQKINESIEKQCGREKLSFQFIRTTIHEPVSGPSCINVTSHNSPAAFLALGEALKKCGEKYGFTAERQAYASDRYVINLTSTDKLMGDDFSTEFERVYQTALPIAEDRIAITQALGDSLKLGRSGSVEVISNDGNIDLKVTVSSMPIALQKLSALSMTLKNYGIETQIQKDEKGLTTLRTATIRDPKILVGEAFTNSLKENISRLMENVQPKMPNEPAQKAPPPTQEISIHSEPPLKEKTPIKQDNVTPDKYVPLAAVAVAKKNSGSIFSERKPAIDTSVSTAPEKMPAIDKTLYDWISTDPAYLALKEKIKVIDIRIEKNPVTQNQDFNTKKRDAIEEIVNKIESLQTTDSSLKEIYEFLKDPTRIAAINRSTSNLPAPFRTTVESKELLKTLIEQVGSKLELEANQLSKESDPEPTFNPNSPRP